MARLATTRKQQASAQLAAAVLVWSGGCGPVWYGVEASGLGSGCVLLSCPVRCGPIWYGLDPTSLESGRVLSGLVCSGSVWYGLESGHVFSGEAHCGPARSLALCLESGLVWSGLVPACVWSLVSVLFCSVLFCSVLFCSVLFCSVLFCSVLFCSVLVRVWSGAVWSGVGASMAGGAPPKACTTRFCGAPDVCPRLLHIPHQGGSSQNELPRSAAQDTQSTASALPSR